MLEGGSWRNPRAQPCVVLIGKMENVGGTSFNSARRRPSRQTTMLYSLIKNKMKYFLVLIKKLNKISVDSVAAPEKMNHFPPPSNPRDRASPGEQRDALLMLWASLQRGTERLPSGCRGK